MSEHCERHPFCIVTYWKGHTASSSDEDWTICKVSPIGTYTYGEQIFENTETSLRDREKLLSFLEKAYARGYAQAKREIREALGVVEPRS